ncbi:MAG: YraN family protein [Gammaproteobacteria bacterium]|nr:YraN family protein [Gammaproteobacteria bacterium]
MKRSERQTPAPKTAGDESLESKTAPRSKTVGDAAEERALSFLQARGLTVLTRNYRCRVGEIDVVARDNDATLIFIEVRYRKTSRYGGAAASVDRRKQQRIARAASHYLQVHRINQATPCRFDVVAMGPGAANIDWITGAFEVESWS